MVSGRASGGLSSGEHVSPTQGAAGGTGVGSGVPEGRVGEGTSLDDCEVPQIEAEKRGLGGRADSGGRVARAV